MSKTSRSILRLLLVAAIAFPLFGCGESKPEMPSTPPPAAGKDPGPPTAAGPAKAK